MAGFLQVGVESGKFFRDVDAHTVNRDFLTNALGDFVLARRGGTFRHHKTQRFQKTIDDLLLMTCDQLRHHRLQAHEDLLHELDALDEACLELSAFALAHVDEVANGGTSGVDHSIAQRRP